MPTQRHDADPASRPPVVTDALREAVAQARAELAAEQQQAQRMHEAAAAKERAELLRVRYDGHTHEH